MTTQQVLRRARSVLKDVRCDATGCFAETGHRAACIRGRAEKVVDLIDRLERQTPVSELQLFHGYGVE